MISIEIVYAKLRHASRYPCQVDVGTTIEAALEHVAPQLFSEHPELQNTPLTVGLYGTLVPLGYSLQENTRIDIYRPLTMDPKTRRRLRHEAKNSYTPNKKHKPA